VHEFQAPPTPPLGLRQRAMIAMAIAKQSRSSDSGRTHDALDVTVQAQIVRSAEKIYARPFPVGLVLISQDLGIIAGVADTVADVRGQT